MFIAVTVAAVGDAGNENIFTDFGFAGIAMTILTHHGGVAGMREARFGVPRFGDLHRAHRVHRQLTGLFLTINGVSGVADAKLK